MRDSEIVASIVAGDPEGLAEAYDRYSASLYSYCRSLLREPADAADAVQDTYVIAASKLARLRDPERLRAWLFAVARNECMHRLRARQAAPWPTIPDQPDEGADVGVEAERAEARALVRAAVGGLNDGERDVINQFWHGLDVPEVATVLGVSRNHAHSLFSRARDQLEASIAVLVVGRSGRADCAALDRLLTGWDGRLTATLRKRVGRHIDRCLVCSDRRRQELRPAMLLSLTPAALLAVAAGRDPVLALGGAGLRLAAAPAGLRAEVLRLSPGTGPHAAALGGGAGRSMRSFGMKGFPKPLHHGHLGLSSLPHLTLGVIGPVAVAATATVVVTAVGPYAHHRPPPAPGAASISLGPAASAAPARAAAARTGGPRPSAPAPAGSGTAEPGQTAPARKRGRSATGSPPAGGSTAPAGAGTPTGTSAPTAAPTPAGTPTATSPAPAPAPGTPSPTPAPITSSVAATLTVSPLSVTLNPLLGGSLTLTAANGPVNWSISEPAAALGSLTISALSGTVYPGSPVTMTLTETAPVALSTTLTVSPGGQAVTVLLGLGLGL